MNWIKQGLFSFLGMGILITDSAYALNLARNETYFSQKPVLAVLSSESHSEKYNQVFIMLSGGIAWASPGQSQTIFLQSDQKNTYNNQKMNQQLGLGELVIGVQKNWLNSIQSQWGMLFSGSGKAKLKGQIWQFADPEFNNMNYSYTVNQWRLGLRSKWIFNVNTITAFKPYITGSIGVSFNYSSNFQNDITIPTAVPNPNFENNYVSSFSYSLGLGVQKEITPHIQLGLGYELLDWGKSHLGRARGQTINSGLGMNHCYLNTLLISASYNLDL